MSQPATTSPAPPMTVRRREEVCASEIGQTFRSEHGRSMPGGGQPMDELSLHILDIALNSFEAGASRVEVAVLEDPARDRLTVEIHDNGRGMDADILAQAVDPFFTTRPTRTGGLGLPLLRQAAEAAGGRLQVRSVPRLGTSVTAEFQASRADRAPLGDLDSTFMVLVTSRPDVEVVLTHRRGADGYELSSADLREAIGGLGLTSPEGVALAREAIRHCEAGLARAGAASGAGQGPTEGAGA